MESPAHHVLIFDHPRSCSNLLGKLLDTHPSTIRLHRPWRKARTFGADKPGLSVTPETAERLRPRMQAAGAQDFSQVTVARANETVIEAIEEAREQGQLAIIQEHTAAIITDSTIHAVLRDPTYLPSPEENTTLIPSSLLKTAIPVLLIRHPALALPSFLRMHLQENMLVPEDEMFRYWISLRWLRIVYTHLESLDLQPVIIDAFDLTNHTSAITSTLCAHFSIAPNQIQETWQPGEGIRQPEGVDESWVETLRKSSGVIRDDREVRVEDLVGGWEEEFGVERAGVLRGLVEGEMGDYGFLWERRVRVRGCCLDRWLVGGSSWKAKKT